jgi:hypothetical protein
VLGSFRMGMRVPVFKEMIAMSTKSEMPVEVLAVRKMSSEETRWQSRAAQMFFSDGYRTMEGDGGRRTLDELSDVFPDERDALRVRVCADGADLVQDLLRTSEEIRWERIRHEFDELRVLLQRRDL